MIAQGGKMMSPRAQNWFGTCVCHTPIYPSSICPPTHPSVQPPMHASLQRWSPIWHTASATSLHGTEVCVGLCWVHTQKWSWSSIRHVKTFTFFCCMETGCAFKYVVENGRQLLCFLGSNSSPLSPLSCLIWVNCKKKKKNYREPSVPLPHLSQR